MGFETPNTSESQEQVPHTMGELKEMESQLRNGESPEKIPGYREALNNMLANIQDENGPEIDDNIDVANMPANAPVSEETQELFRQLRKVAEGNN